MLKIWKMACVPGKTLMFCLQLLSWVIELVDAEEKHLQIEICSFISSQSSLKSGIILKFICAFFSSGSDRWVEIPMPLKKTYWSITCIWKSGKTLSVQRDKFLHSEHSWRSKRQVKKDTNISTSKAPLMSSSHSLYNLQDVPPTFYISAVMLYVLFCIWLLTLNVVCDIHPCCSCNCGLFILISI